MLRSIVAFVTAAALISMLVVATFAAEPNGASGHGADVSAVAKAVHTTQGNAHGKAVSAIANAHGKAVSAAERARAAERQAAGKANGAANKANGTAKANGNGVGHGNGASSSAPGAANAPTEPGRIKGDTSQP